MATARDAAVAQITRDLKRLIIHEQGELLDAIRRTGRRAVAERAATAGRPYEKALLGPLQHFVSQIEVSIDDLDMAAAAATVSSRLSQPVQVRLHELAKDTSSVELLTTRVRAIYRESRSNRAQITAEAAFAAAWPDAN